MNILDRVGSQKMNNTGCPILIKRPFYKEEILNFVKSRIRSWKIRGNRLHLAQREGQGLKSKASLDLTTKNQQWELFNSKVASLRRQVSSLSEAPMRITYQEFFRVRDGLLGSFRFRTLRIHVVPAFVLHSVSEKFIKVAWEGCNGHLSLCTVILSVKNVDCVARAEGKNREFCGVFLCWLFIAEQTFLWLWQAGLL